MSHFTTLVLIEGTNEKTKEQLEKEVSKSLEPFDEIQRK